MLIYSATEKPLSSYGNRFSALIPTDWRGVAGHCHSLQYSVHRHQPDITIPFPVKLGQNAHVGSFPPAAPPAAACEAWPWPPWKKGQWSTPWMFQCFLPRSGALCLCFVSRNMCGESSREPAWSFWQKLAFIFKTNESSRCLFTGEGTTKKASHYCLDQFVTLAAAPRHVSVAN